MGSGLWRYRIGIFPYWTRPNSRNSLSATIITAICFLPLFAQAAYCDVDRIALVLAVENYDHFSPSSVTADTGQKIADAVKARGFVVTVVKNPSDATARAALRDFAQRATGANAAIVVLSGHGVSYDGRTYFLPANAEITRDTDLLSRGLAVPSVAGIVARAKFGGVFFFMTVANLPSTMQSVSARPSFASQLDKNAVVVFSTSDKIPVSRVDRVTEQAATDFIRGVNADPLTAASLVQAGLAGGVGKVFGTVPELNLSKAPTPPPPPQPATQSASIDSKQPLQAEQRAREAEERAREAERRARADAEQAEARAREAEARASEAEARVRTSLAAPPPTDSATEHASPPPTAAVSSPAAISDEIKSLTTVEELFGNAQRMRIQFQLKKLSLYKGEIDAVFGDLTREAIREYQKGRGETETGYLTPQQLQSLLGG
ncbi:MAG: peptidoglycan-binding protein [Hyphomicrobium sp.]